MLDRLNDKLSKLACFFLGHKTYRVVYSGENAHVFSGMGHYGVTRVKPVFVKEPTAFCQRCGKRLGTVENIDKNEKYEGL